MDFGEEEIVKFLKCLNDSKVKYILVGGFAVNVNGFNRSTNDLDIWLKDDMENRKNFVDGLTSYGIIGADVFTSLPFIAGYTEIILNNGYPVDVMADLQFLKQNNFDDCHNFCLNFEIENDISVPILHLNHLIKEKENSKRPKDVLDVQELKQLYKL